MTLEQHPDLVGLAGSKVELLISCTDLADLDEFTKSDPMCVLFVKQFGQWKEFSRTEAIRETLNPKFVESFVIDFEPSHSQQLMFSVYDIDSRSTDLKHHDYVGSTEVSLLSLIDPDRPIKSTCKTLRVGGDPKPRGVISITAEIIKENKHKVYIHAGGHKLDKKGLFSMNKPDVYLEVCRSIDNMTYHPVYRTETIYKTTRPRWRPFDLNIQRLCNGEWDRHIQFSCWHFSGNDYHLIGRKVTTLREMNNLPMNGHYKELFISSPKKEKSSKKHTVAGQIRFFQFRVDMKYSLLDFVRGGLQLNLMIAVDFTASNGDPNEDLSLHTIKDFRENQYLDAIENLGTLIANYNTEKKVAAFGFGATWKGKRTSAKCFPLTGEENQVYLKGIKLVEETYEKILPDLQFSGPTRIAPVIEKAAAYAERENMCQDKQAYTVLLVITDGVINDINKTLRRIISTSHLPYSIIFVGVGPADFNLMEQFHTTQGCPLKNNKTGESAVRSNTHFVAFRKENLLTGGNITLAREAFATLSTQVLEYMRKNNIHPNKPKLSRYERSIPDKEDMEGNGTMRKSGSKFSLSSRQSFKFVQSTGPSCPTCGAAIEPGTNLYSEVSNMS